MICLSCGRVLKSTSSIETGYGPVCYKKKFGSNLHKNSKCGDLSYLDIPYYDIPGQMTLDDYLQAKLSE